MESEAPQHTGWGGSTVRRPGVWPRAFPLTCFVTFGRVHFPGLGFLVCEVTGEITWPPSVKFYLMLPSSPAKQQLEVGKVWG